MLVGGKLTNLWKEWIKGNGILATITSITIIKLREKIYIIVSDESVGWCEAQ